MKPLGGLAATERAVNTPKTMNFRLAWWVTVGLTASLGCATVVTDDVSTDDNGSGGSSPSGGGLGVGGSPGAGGRGVGGRGPGAGGGPGVGGSPGPSLGKFVGNITTNNQVDAAGKKFATHWDQITPENAGKWGSVQQTAGAGFNWGSLDAIYDYSEQNNIIFKQHAFVWGSQQPQGNPNEAQVKSWMKSFCERYKNVKLIDVVNEPPPHTTPSYVNNIGGGTDSTWAWVTNSFKWAKEACPGAILILNDYNNIEWPNDNQHFIDIVKRIQQDGAPIDAVGAQSHDLDNQQVPWDRVRMLIEKLHNDTGLPVYITEYDISTTDDQAQLRAYQEHIPYFMEQSFIPGITIWGWIVGRTWSQAPNSGLVTQQGQPRPAMTWLMEELGRPTP
jgi:endo-1,4-beta-xylanase